MTDTRTSPNTTTTNDAEVERDREREPERAAELDTNSQETLTTADIAGQPRADQSHVITTRADDASRSEAAVAGREGATAGREDASTGREAERTDRDHTSEIPGPTVAPLFSDDAANDLRERWTDVQAGFVDEPRNAVEQADGLVAEVMKRLADSFATERQALEQQWSSGQDASTEDLRIALRRYRSFFDRLLSV